MHPERSLNMTYTFLQTVPYYTIAQSALTSTVGAYYFSLSQLPQATTFTSLFDQYRVDELEVTLFPMFRANAFPASVGAVLTPLIYTVVDLDDATAPSLLSDLYEYQNTQVHSDDKPFSFRFKPKVGLATYTGGLAGYTVTNGWIDAASTSVQHYGWKHALSPGSSGQVALQVWNVSTKVKISFKNVR